MKKLKVLSLDGGGIRGLLSCYLLFLLEKEIPFLSKVDLFAGTSTGSLMALALASGQNPEQLIGFYEMLGPKIFTPHPSSDPYQKAKYLNTPLQQILHELVFPHKLSLKQIPKKVVIPTFDIEAKDGWKPLIFHNMSDAFADHTVADVALSSCSAPFYFPSYQGKIDGGVCANHPGLCALVLSTEHKLSDNEHVSMLSFGTGQLPDKISHEIDWGVEKWSDPKSSSLHLSPHPFFTLVTQGSSQITDFYLYHLLRSRYHRVNPRLDKPVPLDGFNYALELKETALAYPAKYPAEWKSLQDFVKQSFLN